MNKSEAELHIFMLHLTLNLKYPPPPKKKKTGFEFLLKLIFLRASNQGISGVCDITKVQCP